MTQKSFTYFLSCLGYLALIIIIGWAQAPSVEAILLPPNSCTQGKNVDRVFFIEVAKQLTNPSTSNYEFVADMLEAWKPYEGTKACWNPLATTRKATGATNFNRVGVKNYPSQATGIRATAETLNLSYYKSIRKMLAGETFDREALRSALGTWGTCKGTKCNSLLNKWQSLWDANQGGQSSLSPTPLPSNTCLKPFYRFYNSTTLEHFYTTNWDEVITLSKPEWGAEGIVGYLAATNSCYAPDAQPIYRYRSDAYGEHFYTFDWNELGQGNTNWVYEGIAGYGLRNNNDTYHTQAVYRYWNTTTKKHFYTQASDELGSGRDGWASEGIAGYVFKPEALALKQGDVIILKTLGDIDGPRYLDGRTSDGTVGLAPSTEGSYTGTKWKVYDEDGDGIISLQTLGVIDGPRWLDGRTGDGTVGLAPNREGQFTGTKWQVIYLSNGEILLKCLGDLEGPRWLDGRTGDGTVGLAPTTESPYTGSHWLVVR